MEGTRFRKLAAGDETTYDVTIHPHDGGSDKKLENLQGVFVLADDGEEGPTVYFRGNWVPSGCDSALAWLRSLAAHMAIINRRIAGEEDYELQYDDVIYTLAAAAGIEPKVVIDEIGGDDVR